ncbi:MAG TPA: thioredoxin family protein [Burkholderiales bacterium]|nr:thioredoxin family protein [Burkholderiales bacterium]
MTVTCFCAAWCHVCAEYRDGFFSLAARFPQARFAWLDIEDDADEVGDREVENFPTILVEKDGKDLFYGPLPPQHAHLARLLETLSG